MAQEQHKYHEWFTEPTSDDVQPHRRGNQPHEWLRSSDQPVARTMRRFLNENISDLPADARKAFFSNLHSRWRAAYVELIIARALQLLGASIEIEKESAAGTRIDFQARFPDTTISVEAIAPVFNAHV